MEKTKEYILFAGSVLHDPVNKDFSKLLTPQTLTEELALHHLAHNPRARKYFDVLPSDVDQRIEEYLSSEGAGVAEEVKDSKATELADLDRQIEVKQSEIETKATELADLDRQIEVKQGEIAELEKRAAALANPESEERGDSEAEVKPRRGRKPAEQSGAEE